MKKLFAFLLGLNASLGALAYNNPSGFSGVSFQDIGSDTQLIEMSSPNALSAWATDATALGYMGQTSRTKLVITGPMSASDFTALSGDTWKSFTTVDLSKVTVTDPSYISNMTLANAETIILPNGLTKADIQGLQGEAKNVVAGMTGGMETKPVTTYWYTVPGSTEEQEYTGTVSAGEGQQTVTVNNMSVWKDLDNAEGYPELKYKPMNIDLYFDISEEYVHSKDMGGWSKNVAILSEFPVQVTVETWNNNVTYYYNPFTNQQVSLDPSDAGIKTFISNGNTYYYKVIKFNQEKEFDVTGKYLYTYKDFNGNTITVDGNGNQTTTPSQNADADGKVELKYSGELTVYPKTENVTSYVVDDMIAYVNTAGSLSSVASAIYDANVVSQYRGAKNITIMGNINNSDLTELSATNFGSVEYLNMKDAVLNGNITTISSKPTAAIVLPKIMDGESIRCINYTELGTIQSNGQWVGFPKPNKPNETISKFVTNNVCLAYFDSNNDNKLNVYAYDATVSKLQDVVTNSTEITFIPLFKNTGEFFDYMGNHHITTDRFEPFRTALGDLQAICMDFTQVNQMMTPDFNSLNANTHYISVPGNVYNNGEYSETYDITCETTTSVYKYPSTVWVVSAYRTNETFVLDENGNKIPRVDNEGKIIYESDGKTPKYQKTGDANYIHYGGKFLQATEPTNITYVRDRSKLTIDGETSLEEAGYQTALLAGAKEYFSNEESYATRQIFAGFYTKDEITAIDNDIHGNVFDFMYGANFTQETVGEGDAAKTLDCVVNLDNDNVKYILLPDNHEADINATSADNCSFSTCSNLLCVGAYNTTTNTLTTWSSAPGNVYAVTSKIRPQKTGRGTGLICATLNNVVMSGALNWDDISTNADNGKNNGLENATILTADLTNAYFPNNEHMVFSTASWGSITSILLPTSSGMTLIPDYCLDGAIGLTEICIPSNYEIIGIQAFHGTGLNCVYTTAYPGDEEKFDVDTDDDGIADVYNHGKNTCTLSSNVKEIRRGAFCTTQSGNSQKDPEENTSFSDVYVLRAEAPICKGNAFHSISYMGNNHFKGSTAHPISRNSYISGDNRYIAVLHYPSSVTPEQEAKFTDVTRDYTLTDEMGMYNNKGEIISWPRVTEFERAYNQAVSGVTWNAWPTTRPQGTLEHVSWGNYNEIVWDGTSKGLTTDENGQQQLGGTSIYYFSDNTGVVAELPDPTSDKNIYPGSYNSQYAYDWQNYMGWHQFVLTNGNSTQQNKTIATEYVNGGWYTLCLPYDMTAAEVVEAMGAPAGSTFDNTKGYNHHSELGYFPRVYSLRTVKRDYPHINLTFSYELMAKTAAGQTLSFDNEQGTINYDTPSEMYKKKGEVVYLRGGYPYMVRPLVPANNPNVIGNNLGEYILRNMNFDADDLGNKYSVKAGQEIAMPIINQKILALDKNDQPVIFSSTDDDNLDTDYYYYFQGTYADEEMPEAYYLSGGSWKRQRNDSPKQTWEGFTAIIGGKADKATGSVYKTDNPNPKTFSGITSYYVSLTSKNDDFTKVGDNRVKYQFLFEGEEGFDEAVAIDKIDGKDINAVTEGNVYNMAGQLVGSSLDGLAKGLYIQNGKKVMVK